jgi:predicted phage-related endonuclease
METHDILQGTPEWGAYRATHFNASDAPAMLGRSPYKSRTELLHERHTGLAPEIDAATQARFDDGHRFEALMRPRAEEIIGQELYPVIGSAGKLSASFDGLTMMEDVVWEHKTINDAIRAAETANDLPEYLRIQMDQQLLIAGAGRALFSASRWDAADNLIEEKHLWYDGDHALQAEIVAGWEQFGKDLAAYVPTTATEKPVAEAIMALPALIVQTRGEVVSSNLPAFKAAAERFIAGVKTDLETDEDFVNAEATVKYCDAAEKALQQAKSAALEQTTSIAEVLRVIDHLDEQFSKCRLNLSKQIEAEKKRIKETIHNEGRREYADHIAALEKEIAPLRLQLAQPDFAGAMKGKRTLKSLQDAVDTTLANAKIAASTAAADIRAKLAWLEGSHSGYDMLFPPVLMQQIVGKPMDDFQLVVHTRIADHERAEAAKAEALRTRIAAEEKTKAEAAAKAKMDAEMAAAAKTRQDEENAERARVAAETKRQMEAQQVSIAAERKKLEGENAAQAWDRRAAGQDAVEVARLQRLADQNVADKREFAQAERITGVPVATRPYPAAGAAPAAMLDATDVELSPTDEEIVELMFETFGMSAAEAIDRLAKFDPIAARAALAIAA